jgi:hypothetical protein
MSSRGPTFASVGMNLGQTVELTFTLATNSKAFTFVLGGPCLLFGTPAMQGLAPYILRPQCYPRVVHREKPVKAQIRRA